MTYNLILLRHGESEWNQKNLFTGWVDVTLTDKGRAEGARAGELLRKKELIPDVVYTSRLKRAILTANIPLGAAELAGLAGALGIGVVADPGGVRLSAVLDLAPVLRPPASGPGRQLRVLAGG